MSDKIASYLRKPLYNAEDVEKYDIRILRSENDTHAFIYSNKLNVVERDRSDDVGVARLIQRIKEAESNVID